MEKIARMNCAGYYNGEGVNNKLRDPSYPDNKLDGTKLRWNMS